LFVSSQLDVPQLEGVDQPSPLGGNRRGSAFSPSTYSCPT